MFYRIPKNINEQLRFNIVNGGRGCGRSLFKDYCISKLLINDVKEYMIHFNVTVTPECESGFNNLLVKSLLLQERIENV